MGLWEQELDISVPIEVDANFTDLGPKDPDTGELSLGLAGAANNVLRNGNLVPVSLAIQIDGSDTYSGAEINARFNNNADAPWYYGTDANPGPGQYDFVTVVLHELGHGLGFASSAIYESLAPGQGSLIGLHSLVLLIRDYLQQKLVARLFPF